MIAPPEASAILCDMASPTNAGVNLWAAAERFMSREGDGGEEALSSRKQELRLLVEAIPALVRRAGPDGNVDFVAQLQAILNVVPTYTWYAAPSGALTFVNKRTGDYLGLPKDHPLRLGIDISAQWDDWVPLLHPDDQEESRKYWSNCLRTGEAGEQSYRVRSAQGDYRWFLSRFEPLRAGDGTLVLWVGATLDIEEGKKAEDLLRRSEAHLAEAQRLSHTGAVAYNGTAILFASEETYRIWGFDPAQGLPSREVVFQRIHPGDRDWLNAEVRRAVGEKRRYSIAYRILLPDGTVKHLETIGQPVFSASGELVEIFATQTDVTERKRAEEALRESEHRLRQLQSDLARVNRLSMMGELAASLAHEISQPIATARNNARAAMNFLDRSTPDPGQIREALTCILDDADRAGDILDRIRDHIKKAPLRKECVDLNHAIIDVIALAQGAIVKNGVSIQTRLAEGLSDVQADRVQLQQVVLNLILNAAEAMGSIEEGVRELSIATKRYEGGGVLVAVRDSGPGIDPELLDRVFDAFYTTKSTGVGMGLSICRSIIDAHAGRLWADVNTPRGAVFRFTLPNADNELTNSFRPAQLAREPREDTVSDAAHQRAYEGNKRPHRSGRGCVPRRRGRQ
jgi:PAS domain S-box-containing protein